MELATHLHLVPRLTINRAVSLLHLCAFVVWSWAYHGTWVFITVFTTAQYWMVLRASTIQSTYACIVCQRPSFQGPWFTFCTFYLISHICVPCLSCPWLLPSHKCCNFGLVHLFLYAIIAFLGLWVTVIYLLFMCFYIYLVTTLMNYHILCFFVCSLRILLSRHYQSPRTSLCHLIAECQTSTLCLFDLWSRRWCHLLRHSPWAIASAGALRKWVASASCVPLGSSSVVLAWHTVHATGLTHIWCNLKNTNILLDIVLSNL
jgi:hypothetical protein